MKQLVSLHFILLALKKVFSYFFILLSFTLVSVAYGQDTSFYSITGCKSYENARDIVQTSDSGFVIVGSTGSQGTGNSDVYLLKQDKLGKVVWSAVFGSSQIEWGESIAVCHDKGFVIAGYTNNTQNNDYDFLLIKTDSLGKLKWVKTYGGNDWDLAYSVVQTSDSGFAIGGETKSFGLNNTDFYIIKTDSVGNLMWQNNYGGTSSEVGRSIIQTLDGGYAIAGETKSFGTGLYNSYLVKTDANGVMLWDKFYERDSANTVFALIQDTDSSYAMAGHRVHPVNKSLDFYLFKTNSIGDTLWTNTIGGPDAEEWFDLIKDRNGNYSACGYSFTTIGAGKEDIFLYQINPFGGFLNLSTYGGLEYERGYGVVSLIEGGFAMAGTTDSYGAGIEDIILVRTRVGASDVNHSMIINTECSADSNAILSVEDVKENLTINAYPNPFKDFTNINIPFDSNFTFYLMDISGKVIITESVSETKNYILEKNSLKSGIYFFTIQFHSINEIPVKSMTGKLIILDN